MQNTNKTTPTTKTWMDKSSGPGHTSQSHVKVRDSFWCGDYHPKKRSESSLTCSVMRNPHTCRNGSQNVEQ
ncbi:hypothetical protein JTE90_015471 [Oedothorax gibbosus]|uniref:Uncharacterized protein n=1 Tax=Oedothorax gibbosus TaxID=931172 RepID=A0AAV6ULX8_9ARAC|nr:hypothetical protein JTE90_015471 [Oedothorax gibbosus]